MGALHSLSAVFINPLGILLFSHPLRELAMKREAEFTVLLLILAAGLALRVMRFDAIAPTNSDEGSYLKHARLMVTVMKMGAGVNVPVVDAGKEGIWRYVRKQDWSAKPCWLHSFLMALAMLAFGVGDGAGALVNVVFSLAAVVAVYLIARRSPRRSLQDFWPSRSTG